MLAISRDTDVTSLRRAQDRLTERQGELNALTQHMPVGLVAHGPDSAVLFANPRAGER